MANDIGPRIAIEGEAEFKKALADINRNLKVLDSEMRAVASSFDKGDNSVKSLTSRNEVLTKQIDEQKKKLAEQSAALEKSTKQFGEGDKQTQEYQRQVNLTTAEINNLTRELEKNEAQLKKNADSGQMLGEKIGGGAKIAMKAVAALGAAVGAMLGASVAVGGAYESEMSNIAAITQMTADEMEQVSDGIRATALNTGRDVQEIARNTKMLAESGGDIGLLMEQLAHGTNLATATQSDLGTTLDFLGSTMKTFKVEAENTQGAVDSFAAVTTLANVELSQLGESYVNVGGAAANAGMNINDVNAFLVTFSENGLKGGAAGTSLNAVLRNLSTPTAKAAKELKKLDVALYDTATGASRDMLDIMSDLEGALSGLTDEQRNRYESVIFDTVAQKGWNMIAADGIDSIRGLSGELSKSSDEFNGIGTAAGMAARQMDNLQGDVKMFKGQLADVGIQVYQQLNAPLREAAQEGGKNVGRLAEELAKPHMTEAIGKLGDSFTGLVKTISGIAADAIPVLLKGFAGIITHADKVVPAVGGIFAAVKTKDAVTGVVKFTAELAGIKNASEKAKKDIGGLIKELGGFKGAAATWGNSIKSLFKSLTSPIGLVTLAVGTLVGVLAYTYAKSLDDTKRKTDELIKSSKEFADTVNASEINFKTNISDINAQFGAAETLIGKIEELAGIEDRSADEKGKLALYVEQLNKALGEEVAHYDALNDVMSHTPGQIREIISAKKEMMMQEAYEKRQLELLEEQIKAQEIITDLYEQREAVVKRVSDTSARAGGYNIFSNQAHQNAVRQLKEINAQIYEQEQAVDKANAKFDEYAGIIIESRAGQEEFADTVEDSNNRIGKSMDQLLADQEAAAKREEELLKERQKKLESYTAIATDMFSKISDENKTSVAEMTENLEHNAEKTREWAKNLEELAHRGVSEGLVREMAEGGPKMAAVLADIVNASDEELQKLSDAFADSARAAQEALDREMDAFEQRGIDMMESLARGIDIGMEAVRAALGFAGLGTLAGYMDIGRRFNDQMARIIPAAAGGQLATAGAPAVVNVTVPLNMDGRRVTQSTARIQYENNRSLERSVGIRK